MLGFGGAARVGLVPPGGGGGGGAQKGEGGSGVVGVAERRFSLFFTSFFFVFFPFLGCVCVYACVVVIVVMVVGRLESNKQTKAKGERAGEGSVSVLIGCFLLSFFKENKGRKLWGVIYYLFLSPPPPFLLPCFLSNQPLKIHGWK